MRTFVTGASGFIGSHVCATLAAAGHDVVPVSVRQSVPALDGAQAVVHLARCDFSLTQQIGGAAAACGARLVFMSSIKVHGEESEALLTGNSPLQPQDDYAVSKVRSEEALRAIARLRLVVLRPPLVYGPGVKGNFLALMRAIDRGLPLPLAGIANRRSVVYVGNVADAVLRCLELDGGTFLLADGAPLSTPQLCRAIGAALGREARLFAFPRGLLPRKLAASQAIDQAALAWRAPFTLAQGLQATAAWYRIG